MIRPEADLIFNLLSIGQQGVGKTVFLASSYSELNNSRQEVVACQDRSQQHLEDILNDIQRGQYPPPTQTSRQFHFRLKQTGSPQTLCQLRWWDFPGRSSQISNPDFQQAILDSHGCCVLINAEALMHQPTYLQTLEEIVQQVLTIGFLANQHGLDYPFALILTQCDRLEPDEERFIEPKLSPLVSRLDGVIHYKTFLGAVPLVQGASRDHSAAMPMLWLLSQLTQSHRQPPNLGSQLRQSLAAGRTLWSSSRNESPTVRRYMSILALANVSLQALTVIEKRVEDHPDDLHEQLTLARFYESRGQKQTAETIYDHILTQQNNNLKALMSKALLRSEQGDVETARKLLSQAQKLAPNDTWKAKIEAIASAAFRQRPQITGDSETQ